MNSEKDLSGLLRLQHILTWVVVIAFVVAIPVYLLNREIGINLCYVSMFILMTSALIRLGWISRHFRRTGQWKSRLLTLAIIALILLSILLTLTR